MPTPFSVRKAVSSTPVCEVWLGSPGSLARDMLTKGLSVNPGELPASPLFGHPVARAGEQSYDSIVPMKVENRRAPEKGRPRYPLEGRDEQVDVSVQSHMHETLNSRRHVKWN